MPSLHLTAAASAPRTSSANLTILPRSFATCLGWLQLDYATCGTPKADADHRFLACTNASAASTDSAGTIAADWVADWVDSLQALLLPTKSLLALLGSLDTNAYVEAQLSSCECRPSLATAEAPSHATGAGVSVADRCFVASVGRAADPQVVSSK